MRPNPWFFVPVAVSLALGFGLGWMMAGVSCGGSCPVSQWVTALIVGIGIAGGVGVVAVLGIRSMDEYRVAQDRGQEPPGPGCEVPED